ncbi:predicted protein [Arabidopsis lyrata subsp. lyrata]|uniref:Predicted protein n=1 Tax=Arabidopsis lyrata subsp. lyrata TaxID=81972 RepID=D7L494_ARALL|nr:predicted protein [Arabidopsis lyrata subsp. lyrata]
MEARPLLSVRRMMLTPVKAFAKPRPAMKLEKGRWRLSHDAGKGAGEGDSLRSSEKVAAKLDLR